jgi:hypothetical protein
VDGYSLHQQTTELVEIMRILQSGRTALVLIFVILLASAFASASVTVRVSSPYNGATVGGSFTLYASASSSYGVSGWYIYVDNNAAWHTAGPTGSIAAPLSLSAGTHSVRVRAWDNTGAYGDALLTLTATQSGVQVSVQSPSNGATVGSPATVTASASSPNGISGWVVYMDDQNVYQVDNYSNWLSAQVNMPSGTHSVYVRAWDRNGSYGTSPRFAVNVGSGIGISTPPSSAVVLSKMEETPDSQWGSCSDCAGALHSTDNFWTAAYQTSPSMDGASRQFYVGGSPWTAALFYHKLGSWGGQYNYATHFIWDFYVYVDSASLNNVWTFEFDLFQAIGGWEYMIGSHCSIGDGYWYGWNQQTYQWIKLGNAPCIKSQWAPGWHHVTWYVERIPGSHYYKYDSLVMDGRTYPLNLTQPASPMNWGDVTGVQWQVDTNGNGGGVHWWIDRAKLTLW